MSNKLYAFECGVLLSQDDEEFKYYACNNPSLPYGFYDEDQGFLGKSNLEEKRAEMRKYVENGVDRTYAVISYQGDCKENELEDWIRSEGGQNYSFFKNKDDIIYSVCKIDGEIREGFLERLIDESLEYPHQNPHNDSLTDTESFVSDFADFNIDKEPPEIKALQCEISNLRHELDGVAGYDYEDEVAPFIEKQLFIRECQLYAAVNGINKEKENSTHDISLDSKIKTAASCADETHTTPDEHVVKNLISAMAEYGAEYTWCDSEVIDALVEVGLTQEDFKKAGYGDFVKNYFDEEDWFESLDEIDQDCVQQYEFLLGRKLKDWDEYMEFDKQVDEMILEWESPKEFFDAYPALQKYATLQIDERIQSAASRVPQTDAFVLKEKEPHDREAK